MNTAISVYNTVTALGADCEVYNKQIVLNGGQGTPPNPTINIPYVAIKSSSGVIAPVTEVDQVTTGTITGANSTLYAIALEYMDTVQKKVVTNVFTYTSGSVNTGNNLLDEIANAFIAQIQAEPSIPITPTLSAHTLVLTAVATTTSLTNGTQQFSVTNVGNGIIAFVTGTPAVAPVGLGYIINQGPTANANITNSAYYYQVNLDFGDPAYGDVVMSNSTQVDKACIYVLSTATNVATLVGSYGTLTYALAGKAATIHATTGASGAVANGVITIGDGDIFYGNSDTNVGLVSSDVVVIGTTPYIIGSFLTGTTASTASIPNDQGAAAGFYVHLTSIL